MNKQLNSCKDSFPNQKNNSHMREKQQTEIRKWSRIKKCLGKWNWPSYVHLDWPSTNNNATWKNWWRIIVKCHWSLQVCSVNPWLYGSLGFFPQGQPSNLFIISCFKFLCFFIFCLFFYFLLFCLFLLRVLHFLHKWTHSVYTYTMVMWRPGRARPKSRVQSDRVKGCR